MLFAIFRTGRNTDRDLVAKSHDSPKSLLHDTSNWFIAIVSFSLRIANTKAATISKLVENAVLFSEQEH